MTKTTSFSLAPQYLWQPIDLLNGFQAGSQYNLFSINMGETSNPQVEREALKVVGSYGRQIGHIQEALEVLIKHVPMSKLNADEKEALKVLKRDIATVRRLKQTYSE